LEIALVARDAKFENLFHGVVVCFRDGKIVTTQTRRRSQSGAKQWQAYHHTK
jgi:hypothetical protein